MTPPPLTTEQAEVVSRIHATPRGKHYAANSRRGYAARGVPLQAARWADANGETLAEAARRFGTSKSAVGRAWRRAMIGGGK